MATKRVKKTDVVSPSSAELRKAVEAIAIQPKSGKITLLTRKLFNVLLAVAQQADEAGDTYRALLSDIVANSAFDSNDTALVKEHLRRMVSVQVEWSQGTSSQKPGRKWGISTLIADAEILEDPQTRRVWVEFSFAPKIKKKLLDPVQYARLSLQFQSQLRSSAGLALYEICVRYLTNPSHLTMRETWEWWRPILSGTPDTEAGDEAKREYKYFKRDYLRPAIAEVNAVTNIFVELIEHREGRRVAEIQFRVTERKQPMLALDEHPNVFDSTLVDRMVKIGIPLKEAQSLYADSEENRIRAALQLTEQRMRSTSLPPASVCQFISFTLLLRWVECVGLIRSVQCPFDSLGDWFHASARPPADARRRNSATSPIATHHVATIRISYCAVTPPCRATPIGDSVR